MPSEIKTKNIAVATFASTWSALANGSARASASIDNSTTDYPAAIINLRIKSGAVDPTAGTLYEIYLLRHDGIIGTDAWAGTDAAITIENAPLLGTIVVTATADKNFYAEFDTSVLGPLGPTWGIALKNSSGQAIATDATEAVFRKAYQNYVPEIN